MGARKYKEEVPDCIAIIPRNAEGFIKLARRIISKDYKISPCGSKVCIPVTSLEEAYRIASEKGYSIENCGHENLIPRETRIKSLSEAFPHLDIHSFVSVGDIAIFHPRPGYDTEKLKEPAVYLVDNLGFKSVFAKLSTIGSERKPVLVHLAGEYNTRTVHKEYGLEFEVDIADAYINPRLGSDRRSVAEQSKDNELILDLFSGIGGHSLHIASMRDSRIVAVDMNPTAVYFQAKNIIRNKKKLKGSIDLYVMDAAKAPKVFLPVFDRIISDNPTMHEEFIPVECSLSKPGTIIHHYMVHGESISQYTIENYYKMHGCRVRIINARRTLAYSPRSYIWRIDLEVRKQ